MHAVPARALVFIWLGLLALPLVNCGGGSGGGGGGGGGGPAGCGCLQSGAVGANVASGTTMTAAELTLADQVLAQVNAERSARALTPLVWHTLAAQVAYDHCIYQESIGAITHDGPGACTAPTDCLLARLVAGGIAQLSFSAWGENVARGQVDVDAVMCGTLSWMLSAGHCGNILEPTFTHVGIAVRLGGAGGPYWTQVFLRIP